MYHLGRSRPEQLTIPRLGALLASVAVLVAIAALNLGHVAGRSALLGHVTLLTTVAAALGTGLGAVLGEVTHCG